jgi:DNA polymerase III delta subunit
VSVEEIYNLWQADSEIHKLIAYASGREIFADDISRLVPENVEVDVLALTNAIAENQKQKTMDLLDRFLKDQNSSDTKGSVIQLNALLSEQFRNVAMVQDFLSRKISENKILETTGWKSGRLFVMKKIAARFSAKIILDGLNKLSALDDELKTGSVPPRVLLDLILAQFFV